MMMKIEDVKPAHCYARARRLLGEAALIRDELGRSEDTRTVPEIAGAQPREVYFEAIACWRKAERLANELGVEGVGGAFATPALRDLRPGHVFLLLDGVLAIVDRIKARLGIKETASEPSIEADRQPSDVLLTVLRVNRELSRCLERPFTPSDVYQTVALASAYATALGATADTAAFERRKKPQHCYEQLASCLTAAAAHVGKKGETALNARGAPPDVLPGDVYDMANLVLGELAFLHSLSGGAQMVHAFEPSGTGHRLPSHVFQLAKTLEKQLSALK
jgi:hypothetical protein